ncbi:uncharacterized protein LOC110417742 isoform X2 [Herrania umbratica]|uniref:Uncharacterized protein LOC110417742 isoform X2 n=1 Tax=Herrania umbratica TaxID=108875 RepID=A0A6J1AFF3_9ROSI|nr:uncharacterized protein LOC110417742 isoform X2 [Herrania umbratica]
MKDYATRHSRGEPFSPVGLAVGGASQIQQDRLGTNRPHQLQQPPPSTAWPQFSQFPPLSHNQPYGLQQQQQQSINQPSQLQAVADGEHIAITGHSHSLPQADYTRCSGQVPWCPVDPMVVGPSQSHPQQSSLSHGQSIEQQQLQPQASPCQPQSSLLQDNVDIEHSHLSLTDSALRGIRCALRYSTGPTTNKSYLENQDQLGPIELQSEQTLQSQEQPHQMPQLPEKKKRGRGPTRCLFLNDLADGERIFVHVNKLRQPVGPESAKLSSFLDTIAWNGHRAPLNFVTGGQCQILTKRECGNMFRQS